MRIELSGVGKRYRREWILRDVELTLLAGRQYAITGPNGSGKSTLLKILSGHLSPSKGQVVFNNALSQPVKVDEVYRQLSFAAPYIDLIEDFTLEEAIQFHIRLKPLFPGLTPADFYSLLGFKKARQKPLRAFSSGMKQRLKLALAICSDTPLLLLDEPTTNLDRAGVKWYRTLVQQYSTGRLVAIASNVEEDFDFCGEQISILRYKQSMKP